MPIYEYECSKCGKFEVLQKISEEPLAKCETCGKPVHRLVSLSSFTLVGGGWYKDLYSSTGNKAGTETSGSDSSSSPTASASSSSSSKSKDSPGESKPAKAEVKSDKSSTAAA